MNKDYIGINICDDYEDGGDTYAYVDETDIPETDCKEILDFIEWQLRKNYRINSSIFYYDSKLKYPTIPEEMHFTRHQITLKNLSHERLEYLIYHLNTLELVYDNIPVTFYSES